LTFILQLASYEIPKGLLLDMDGWTSDNGKLTPSGKPVRRNLEKAHNIRLNALFNKLEAADINTQKRLKNIMQAALGIDSLNDNSKFVEIGGDSLSAVKVLSNIKYIL
jgi:hypothetical protein